MFSCPEDQLSKSSVVKRSVVQKFSCPEVQLSKDQKSGVQLSKVQLSKVQMSSSLIDHCMENWPFFVGGLLADLFSNL